MANFTPIFTNQAFDPEQVKTMSDAYDLIIRTFPLDEHEAVALAVLAAGRTGATGLDALCDMALSQLSADEPRPHVEQRV